MRRRAAVPLGFALLLGCTPPEPPQRPNPAERGCREIGCGPSLTLEFEQPEQWYSGAYTIQVGLPERLVTCNVKMPLLCGTPPACDWSARVQVVHSGCSRGIAGQELRGVQLLDLQPEALRVELYSGDELMAASDLQPEYRQVRPAGPECEPVCTLGKDLTVPLVK